MITSGKRSYAICTIILAVVVAGAISLAPSAQASEDTWATPPAAAGGQIVLGVVNVEDKDEDPVATGKAAAEALIKAMGNTPPSAVIVSECFEDREYKEQLLKGLSSVLPEELIMGGSTYGSFSQSGCTDFDAVCLLGIGGDGVSVAAALVTEMGASKLSFDENRELAETRLRTAAKKLAHKLRRTDQDRLLILIPDAHSPKNGPFVEGVQRVIGSQFPITGGSANKNAGQTFVYFRGHFYEDSAVAVMLSGDFKVSLSGRMAKDNDSVIRTAREGAAEALAGAEGKPIAMLAFNCAGRRSKLDNMEEELAAIQEAIGGDLPMFGCYCAGEIGPVDISEKQNDALCGGSGWHVMFTVFSRD